MINNYSDKTEIPCETIRADRDPISKMTDANINTLKETHDILCEIHSNLSGREWKRNEPKEITSLSDAVLSVGEYAIENREMILSIKAILFGV